MRVKVSLLWLLLVISFSLGVSPVVGKTKAYDFTLTDIYGTKISLSDYQGKVVLIDFFRLEPSCQPCIDEIPHLKGVYNEYSRSQVIIMSLSVSSSDTDDSIKKNFVEEYDIPWIVACGAGEIANTEYGVQYIPTLVIVDTNGYYGDPHVGVTPESELISEIDPLLSGTENGDSNGDSDTTQPLPPSDDSDTGLPYTLIAVIVIGVIVFLIIGIVVAGQLLGWSEAPKKSHPRKRPRKRRR